MAPPLQEAVKLVKSDKIKERQEGLQMFKDIFGNTSNLEALKAKAQRSENRSWQIVTQALFSCVLLEKDNCSKKKGDSIENAPAATINRLKQASGTVRWLMEKAAPYLDRSVLTPITAHLTQLLNHRGQLFQPIAIDYLKGLTALISFEPHILSLDTDQWASIATVCFNIILDEKLNKPLDELDTDFWSLLDNDPASTSSLTETQRQSGLIEMEAMRIVELLLTSPSAPLLTSDELGVRVMVKLLRFFENYPQETSSHLSAVSALNRLLTEVELNRRSAVSSFVRRIWKPILSLWPTKNRALKEQLVVTLRIFRATHLAGLNTSDDVVIQQAQLRTAALSQAIIEEPSLRWGITSLSLYNVDLSVAKQSSPLMAFQYNSLQAGRDFDAANALTWGCLELGADVLFDATLSPTATPAPKSLAAAGQEFGAAVIQESVPPIALTAAPAKRGRSLHPEDLSGTLPSDSPQTSLKRRKLIQSELSSDIAAPLGAIFRDLSRPGGEGARFSAVRVWKIQLLLFLILRHWHHLAQIHRNQICNLMVRLLSDEDADVQSWSCLALAAAAHASSQLPPKQVSSELANLWTQAWGLTCRKIHLQSTSRAASHLASLLLQSSLVARETLIADTQTLMSELDFQGPPFPYDSVCNFLIEALKLARRDASLAAMRLEEKALNWLLSAWAPMRGTGHGSFDIHTRIEEQDPADIVRLLSVLSSMPQIPIVRRATPFVPDCAISDRVGYENETAVMRDFVELAIVRREDEISLNVADESGDSQEVAAVSDQPMQISHRRCIVYLEKCVSDFLREWRGDALQETCTFQQVRRSLDMATVALLYAGSLSMNHIVCGSSLWTTSGELLRLLSPLLSKARWSLADRAAMLKSFETLLGICAEPPAGHLPASATLCSPGPFSGVRGDTQKGGKVGYQCHIRSAISRNIRPDAVLQHTWSSPALQTTVVALIDDLVDVFKVSAGGGVEQVDGMEIDDGFGEVKSTMPSSTSRGAIEMTKRSPNGVITSISICAAAVCDLDSFRLRSDQSSPSASDNLLAVLLSSAPELLEQAGTAVFDVMKVRGLSPVAQDAEEMVSMIGEDLLASHEHGRRAEAHFVAFSFLECTMAMWLDDSCQASFANHVAQLCGYLARNVFQKRNRLSWRCRTRLARFIELYIRRQPSLDFWIPPTEFMIAKATPLEVVGRLHDDSDLRVRFALPSVTQAFFSALGDEACRRLLFERGAEDEASAHEMLFVYILERLKANQSDHEGIITRVLMLGNFLVTSSHIREFVYCKLFDVSYVATTFAAQASAMLVAAASTLGYSSSSELFLAQAEGVALAITADDLQIAEIPWRVLGFTSRRECLESAFPLMARTFLVAGEGLGGNYHFDSLLQFVHTQDAEMPMRDTLAYVTAYFFASDLPETAAAASAATAMEATADRALEAVKTTFSAAPMSCHAVSHLPDFLDAVLAELLGLMVDLPGAPLDVLLGKVADADKDIGTLLRRLLHSSQIVEGPRPHRRPAPRHTPLQVYQAILTLGHKYPTIRRSETIFHVLHHMFARIERERCTNEQVRLVQSLKLYLSMFSAGIERSAPVLQALLTGTSVLLQQVDLIDSVLPIVGWSLHTVAELKKGEINLLPSLLLIAEVATKLAAGPQYRQAGRRLQDWLFSFNKVLLTFSKTAQAAASALQLWPSQLPAELVEMLPAITVETLTASIREAPLALLNAILMQRFQKALSAGGVKARTHFATDTVWELLRRCQDTGDASLEVRAATASGLADLLHTCEGRLSTPPPAMLVGLVSSHTLSYHADTTDLSFAFTMAGIKEVLVAHLEGLVEGSSLSVSHLAFMQLRSILSLFPTLNRASRMPRALNLIAEYPSRPVTHRIRSWSSLSESGEAVATAGSFSIWVTYLSVYACDKIAGFENGESFFAQLRPLLSANTAEAAKMLPLLVHTLLIIGYEYQDDQCAASLSTFFSLCINHTGADVKVWSAILDVVLYLRRQPHPGGSIPTDSDLWLVIDFRALARCAVSCSLFASALLFTELAKEHAEGGKEALVSQKDSTDLLYEIYSNVDDPDGFYAIKNPDLTASLVQRLQHEGEWSRAFEMRAAELESVGQGFVPGGLRSITKASASIDQALHQMGFNQLALRLGGALGGNAKEVSFDVAWRTGTWDLAPSQHPQPGTCQSLYSALRAVHRDLDEKSVDLAIASAFSLELSGLEVGAYEVTTSMRRVVRELLSLREAAHWRQQVKELGFSEALLQARALWPLLSNSFDFEDFERIMSVRHILVQSERLRHTEDQIGERLESITHDALLLERSVLVKLSTVARDHDRLQTSTRSVLLALHLDRLVGDSDSTSDSATEEYANVLWVQKEHSMAMQALEELLDQDVENAAATDSASRRPLLLAKMGQWRATARSDQASVIEEKYFFKANRLLGKKAPARDRGKVFRQYAAFADDQYRSLSASSDFERLHNFVAHHEAEIRQHEAREHRQHPSRHHKKAIAALNRDREKLASLEKSRMLFLQRSAVMYSRVLAESDEYDDAVIRFVSIWFENAHSDELNRILERQFDKIPSHKFLVLNHQLSSRLNAVESRSSSASPVRSSSPSPPFQRIIDSLLKRMCSDHPFHTLYSIFALTNTSEGRDQRSSADLSSQALRASGAQTLWHSLRSSRRLAKRIVAVEKVCRACVEWAEVDLKKAGAAALAGGSAAQLFGKPKAIHKLKNEDVPVITAPPAIDLTCEYRTFVAIKSYEDKFSVAGGIHVPKITTCVGSDGLRYKQLFKSADDLRQDAIFQQVFRLVNDLFQHDRRTARRRLEVCTYLVVPLGPQCGLMEFVGNTDAIGNVLRSLHAAFDSAETPDLGYARNAMAKAVKECRTSADRVQVYVDICSRIPPVLRHFFTMNFRLPTAWFVTRLNYVRSNAVASMVGQMLGLGDRHNSNILLDTSDGRVIHIDFGIAFEQGRSLQIPELVPFRLTREVVDGMGPFGVEGTFRRCCEESLRVLREGKEVIKTVLEVLKHDPIFEWSSNPIKVLQAQGGDEGGDMDDPTALIGMDTASLQAEQALNIVMDKLSATLSVEYTVNELIQQAMDPRNLGVIFCGWQPFY